MVGLYRDPNGESIFEKSVTASHPTLGIAKENGSKISDSETQGLRKRIKELEAEVKVCINTSKKNGPLYNYVWEALFSPRIM